MLSTVTKCSYLDIDLDFAPAADMHTLTLYWRRDHNSKQKCQADNLYLQHLLL